MLKMFEWPRERKIIVEVFGGEEKVHESHAWMGHS
jgi:hypothetical protein